MTQFGVYTNVVAVEGTLIVSHGLAIVDAASPDDAVALAVESGVIRPGDLCVVDLTTAQRFAAELSSTVEVKPGARQLDSITPSEGPEAGGTTLTLYGTGFSGIGGVRFEAEGQPTTWAYSFEVVDDHTLTCPTPPGTGTVDVVAFNGDPGDARLAGGFTYTP